MRRRGTLKTYEAPNYAGLSNVVYHARAEGLVTNTSNSYGVVNASGHVTKWTSVLTTTHEFDGNGTAANITLVGSGVDQAVSIAAGARLRHNGLSSVFNAFHFVVGITNLKATIHMVVKIGSSSNPNSIAGFFGNNGGSASNKGINGHFDDRSGSNLSNAFNLGVVKGTSNSFILQATNGNILKPNTWLDIWIQYDMSQAQEDQGLILVNGKPYTLAIRTDTTVMVTTPTYAMEIGDIGNATLNLLSPATVQFKEITFQTGVEADAFRQAFIMARMAKYRIVPEPHSTDGIIFRTQFQLTNLLSETRYYLPVILLQNPVNPLTLVQIFHDSVSHVYESAGKISMRKSTDGGRTWGSKTTVLDPASTEAAYGVGGNYDSTGKIHLFVDTHTALDNTSTNKMYYATSTDDGTNWSSFTDITSSLASDSLASWRIDQRLIETNSALIISYYKVTAEGDATESANYILKSTDGGSTWVTKTVRAKSTTYRNESSLVALTSTNIFLLARDEVTSEWRAYKSTDTGENWSDLGAFDIGEVLTRESPPLLHKFVINGSTVIVFYWARRDTDQLMAAYVPATSLDSTGISAFLQSSKVCLAQGSSSQHYHYGDMCHFNNDMNAIGAWPYDPFPASGPATENLLRTFNVITAQYESIKNLYSL